MTIIYHWRLNVPLSSQFTIAYNLSLPGLFRAIQWNMPSGVAGLLYSKTN
ncbi:hypothetical protein [Candidatus Spongiihabitans sp.]